MPLIAAALYFLAAILPIASAGNFAYVATYSASAANAHQRLLGLKVMLKTVQACLQLS